MERDKKKKKDKVENKRKYAFHVVKKKQTVYTEEFPWEDWDGECEVFGNGKLGECYL